MPQFADLPDDFRCPYRDGCPYLEGLPTQWVLRRYQEASGIHCRYDHQIKEIYAQLDESQRQNQQKDLKIARLEAQLHAQHRRQFKGRKVPPPPSTKSPPAQPRKRGAPVGHPPWQRPKPTRVDLYIQVAAPHECSFCHSTDLRPVKEVYDHLQEDIVLEPRTRTTCYQHNQAYCAQCDKLVSMEGPGELPGAYIGPAAKASAIYLRYQLNVPFRKISQFFHDFFGLKFVPASAYGFERQAVGRGLPLYEDLRQKIQSLSVAHADETSWRNEGRSHWAWYAGDEDLALFHLDAHRSAEAAQTVLGEQFDGTIVADAYASYKGVHPKDWQSCLAHIKTKAKELEQEVALLKGKAADPAALRFCKNIQGFVRDTCRAHRRFSKRPWRARAGKRMELRLARRLRVLCRTPLRYARVEAFRKRLMGPEQKHFFTCFRRPNVPPTNNQAERSLRPLVIMRKVIQGTRSDKGLQNHSVLRSLFETARRQGRKPHQFFLYLFTHSTAQAQAALYRKDLNGKPRPPLRC